MTLFDLIHLSINFEEDSFNIHISGIANQIFVHSLLITGKLHIKALLTFTFYTQCGLPAAS